MKKKVLFIAEELQFNGAVMSLLALLKALPKDRYDISLFLFLHGGELMGRLPKDITLLPEYLSYAVYRLPLKDALVRAVKSLRFDLVVFRLMVALRRRLHFARFPWFWLPKIEIPCDAVFSYADGFAAEMIVSRVIKGKKVCWIHVDLSLWKHWDHVRSAMLSADGYVAVSQNAAKQFLSVANERAVKRTWVVHNIIEADECKCRAEEGSVPVSGSQIRILSYGRITAQKGFDLIPEMARKLEKPFTWLIVGDGPTRDALQAKADQMIVGEYVNFIGQRENPMPYVKAADIVVIPSRSEGWGMTLSEALVLGKPVVATDLPVFREQVRDGVNGLLCPLDDTDAFAEAINRLMCDEDLRNRLSAEAIKYPFTKDRVVEEFAAVIEEVCK